MTALLGQPAQSPTLIGGQTKIVAPIATRWHKLRDAVVDGRVMVLVLDESEQLTPLAKSQFDTERFLAMIDLMGDRVGEYRSGRPLHRGYADLRGVGDAFPSVRR